MLETSMALLLVFTALATFDAAYFHALVVGVHNRPEMRFEHQLHSANACLFPVVVALLYVRDFGGWLLDAAALAAVLSFAIELVDVAHEKTSRKAVGGLSSAEATLHFAMALLRGGSTALVLAAKPVAAYLPGAPLLGETAYPHWVTVAATSLLPPAVALALVHVFFATRPLVRTLRRPQHAYRAAERTRAH